MHPRPLAPALLARRALVGTLLVPLCGWALGGCLAIEEAVPVDQPVFPTGMAISGDKLVVVSSDFDLAYDQGALLVADLAKVRAATVEGDGSVVVDSAYKHGARVPPFGDRPVVTSGGERAYVAMRGSNLISVVDIGADGKLSCGGTEATPECGASPFALQLADTDPFSMLLLSERRENDALVRVDGLITLLSSSRAIFFSDDRRREGPEQMQTNGALDLGVDVAGVRAAVLRPEVAGTDPIVLAAADLDPEVGPSGALLLAFRPRVDSAVARLDVSRATGAFSMRDIVLVPGDDGANDAIVATLRGPDGLARFEIDDDGGLPSLRLSAVAPTCKSPTSLELVQVTTGAGNVVQRVLLTCQDDDTVEAIDPISLQATDALRFNGRGPYDVVANAALDPAVGPAEAFVSFFLDNSIGVIHLVDDEGEPRLVFRGRIGAAAPKPEDGRE